MNNPDDKQIIWAVVAVAVISGLNLYNELDALEEYRAHLGHEQLTAFV